MNEIVTDVTFDEDGFTLHFEPLPKRIVHVAMGRAVIIDYAVDWSVWDYWSNYHRSTVGISTVSAEGLNELP